MRSKITVNQLSAPLFDADLKQALACVDKKMRNVSELNPHWLSFCREKSAMAIETASFILRQKLAIYRQGYPSKNNDPLALIERQLREIKAVYLAFFQLSPGLLYEIKDSAPDVFVWLMLEPEWGERDPHLLLAFNHLEQLSEEMSNMLILQSNVPHLDCFLASLIDGIPKWAPRSFTYMTLRHSLSIGLARHWLKTEKLDARVVFPVLCLLNVEQGRHWVDENALDAEFLFERLLYHPRGELQRDNAWFQRLVANASSFNTSNEIITFAHLLEWKESMPFDPQRKNAPIELALTGNIKWIPRAIEHIKTCDEQEGTRWLQAFYTIYGNGCPVHPKEIGISHEWPDAITAIETWVKNEGDRLDFSARLGERLTYRSTLKALKDPFIHASFRHWIWYQLCIHARLFVFWNPFMPDFQQKALFDKLEALNTASSRFDQRSAHGIVGH